MQWYALRNLVQTWSPLKEDHIEIFKDYMMDNFGVVYVEEQFPGVLYWGGISFPTDIDYTLFLLKYSGTEFDWLVNKDTKCLSV